MRFFILSLLALLLTACMPSSLIVTPDFATLTPQPVPTPAATAMPMPTATPPASGTDANAEGEYFRGFFDMCMHDYGSATYCLNLTKSARAAGWYMQPSVGWVWPFEVSY